MSEGLRQGRFTALQADGTGGLILLGGFLLVIPGFITDFLGLLVLLGWPGAHVSVGAWHAAPPPGRADGVVDLEPEQWRRVDDPALPNRDREHSQAAARLNRLFSCGKPAVLLVPFGAL